VECSGGPLPKDIGYLRLLVGWQNINYIHGIDAYIIVCNYYHTIRLHMSREQLLTGISGRHQLASHLFHPKVRTATT
jgi:hypothetical protein